MMISQPQWADAHLMMITFPTWVLTVGVDAAVDFG